MDRTAEKDQQEIDRELLQSAEAWQIIDGIRDAVDSLRETANECLQVAEQLRQVAEEAQKGVERLTRLLPPTQ